MAGFLYSKDRAIITLTSSGASLTNGSGGSAGTDLDCRASVAGNAQGDFMARFELVCQWATITSIVKGTTIAEVYLVPKMNGTNAPDVDSTSGSSAYPYESFATTFTAVKAPVANTDMRFVSALVQVPSELLTAYIINRSGQTMTANWTLKVVPEQAQYS